MVPYVAIRRKTGKNEKNNTDKLNLSRSLVSNFIINNKSVTYEVEDKFAGQIQFVRVIFL